MSFVVSARKYRPRRFEDVVGQAHVSQTLKKALQTDHLAHAFLFCGPRGVGKTTCARILARVLNCQNAAQTCEPCGTCDNCLASENNASFNIMELDAASNNSVEHIRTLVEQVRFQPQQGKYKVFIIDEVHMLSQSAFNAFLKTLEEPPSYAVFILATTEKHKIIPTILSRCQVFDFKRIEIKDTVAHLQNICDQEGIAAQADALHIIAQKADGALRDALSIFDRIVSSTGKKFGYEDVIANLNILDYDYYFRFTDALLAQDLSQVYLIFDDVQRNGFEGDLFVNGLAEHLRNLLVCKDEATLRLLEVSESLRGRYRQQAALSPASFLLTCLNLCNDCDVNYKMARLKRLHVELYLQKMCFVGLAVGSGQSAVGSGVSPSGVGGVSGSGLPSLEKKNPDLTSAPPETQKMTAPAAAFPAENLPFASFSQVNEPALKYGNGQPDLLENQADEPAPVASSPPSNAQPPAPSLLRKLANNLPKLGKLDDFDAEIVEAETAPAVAARLTQEDLQTAWAGYHSALEKDSVRTVLKNAEVHLEGEKVVAIVGTALAENTIRQESRLMDFLRNQLHAPRLSLEIRIDPAKVPAYVAPPKPLTTSEKYHQMRKTNPLVEEMRKRFDLTLDNE